MRARAKHSIVFVLATFSVFACGSELVSETVTPVRSPSTASPELVTPEIAAPDEETDEFSLTPIVRIDDEGIAIERGIKVSKNVLGARSSTTYSPQTGKTTTSTTYTVDDTLVDFPWVEQITTPAHAEMACNTIGTPGSWRGNPLPINDEVTVGDIKLRIDKPNASTDSLLLTTRNMGNEPVEIQDYAFQLIDNLQAQSHPGPMDYTPSFTETTNLGINDTKTFTIDLNAIADEPVEAEAVVLAFSDWENGDTVYLYVSEPGSTPHICYAFEPHAEAQGLGTTWSNHPAPLGGAVKVDDATTVRVTYAKRGIAQHLIEAYDGLNVDVSYPKNENGELDDGYEFIAFQIEVASLYPLMKGDNAQNPIDSVGVSGRIADEYALEFEDIFSTPGAANLVMLEEPSDADELNAKGYMRLSFVAVTPVEAHDLHVVYALDYSQSPAFLSLEDRPRSRPTPVPVAQATDNGRISLLDKVDALSEEHATKLREALSPKERIAYENLIPNCAQHMVYPSAESRRKVASATETIGSSDFADELPEYFANTDDPDAFCNDLFPSNAIPRMVQELLFNEESGTKAGCTLSQLPGFYYFSSTLMWKTEVGLALWGEDAPVSINSFDGIIELCDWLESYESNN